jgi:phospholipid-binding lipoprotein MlaA
MSMAGLTNMLLLASAPVYSDATPPFEIASPNDAVAAPMQSAQAVPESAVPVADAKTLVIVSAPDAAVALVLLPATPIEATAPLAPDEMAAPEQPLGPTQPAAGESPVAGVIVVTGQIRTPGDPLQNINTESYAITQAIDAAVVSPTAHAYEKAVPEPIRNGLRNFANNLHEPVVFVNFLLQLKPGKAAETAGRFIINSTIGVAGLFDFARRKPINLPQRRNGFADTLGCYGVKPGAFLFVPLVGATSVRDLLGGGLDSFLLPHFVGKPFNQLSFTVPTGAARELDKRVEFDEDLEKVQNSDDPYIAAREYYLQKRQAQIDGLCGKKENSGDIQE